MRILRSVQVSGPRCFLAALCVLQGAASVQAADHAEHFEKTIRPLLVRYCYECHSAASPVVKGGLRVDFKAGLLTGGDSGPAIQPGASEESLLLSAVRYEGLEMPPGKKLSEVEIGHLKQWIDDGAWDPRQEKPRPEDAAEQAFEAVYRERLDWWSLQPVKDYHPPELPQGQISEDSQPSDIDRFLLQALSKAGLNSAPAADRVTLIRRASFAVLGLPPTEQMIQSATRTDSEESWTELVDQLLSSPHFGERWARHWMDVVRYTDTYGYEWDMPAKGAFRYRDYLIRAFNADVPFDQLIREQLAGDLLNPPRINPEMGVNESLIGPMFFQLGEKRHGDSADFEGIHQEMLDNKIDALGKAFLATTLSCARCHDHKLDPVSQRDYYALAGLLIGPRWVTNTVDLPERQAATEQKLRELKQDLRPVLARAWNAAIDSVSTESLLTAAAGNLNRPMEDPLHLWTQIPQSAADKQSFQSSWQQISQKYLDERSRRIADNATHFTPVADFREAIPPGWSVDGTGLQELTKRGDFAVSLDGPTAVVSVLFGGLSTNTLSPRANGAVRTPWTRLLGPGHLSFQVAGGDFAARRIVVDNAFLTERQQYLAAPLPQWQMVDGLSSMTQRNVYIEFATKTSNPNFPPRVGLGGPCSETQAEDPRSWFQILRVVKHVAPFSPKDELNQFSEILSGEPPESREALSDRYRSQLKRSVERWQTGQLADTDIQWLNWLLSSGICSTDSLAMSASPELEVLVSQYRTAEQMLQTPETVNGMADVDDPIDYRINVRGVYDDLGPAVPHGVPQYLTDVCQRARLEPQDSHESLSQAATRLVLANRIATADNPLTARVYVNRIWHWMFGSGLVTTTDDFGQAGETPSHPELLDFLARQLTTTRWSTKSMIRSILLSRTWRQSQSTTADARDKDPTNRLRHHFPVQRLDAESLRDAILSVSGRLDLSVFGPTTNPWRLNEDPQKRLFSGPVDGNGRRSLYTKVTIMEPPRFLAVFNQPAPKIPTGRRDVSTTPAQSLALLNDPFVREQAEFWAANLVQRPDRNVQSRLEHMMLSAYGRPANSEEISRWSDAVKDFAKDFGVADNQVLSNVPVWSAVAHAVFNTKEFLYVR